MRDWSVLTLDLCVDYTVQQKKYIKIGQSVRCVTTVNRESKKMWILPSCEETQ